MKQKPKCGICGKYAKIEKIEFPRSKNEVNFICKQHGIINEFVIWSKNI